MSKEGMKFVCEWGGHDSALITDYEKEIKDLIKEYGEELYMEATYDNSFNMYRPFTDEERESIKAKREEKDRAEKRERKEVYLILKKEFENETN